MQAAEEPLEISVQDVKRLLDSGADFLFIDCREPEERALCSIAGTRLIPLGEMAGRVAELAGERDRRVVVHCHLGGRSLRAAAWLRSQGFARAQSMAGGIDQWAVEVEPALARY